MFCWGGDNTILNDYSQHLICSALSILVSPNFYSMNIYMIGKIYEKMGDKESAAVYLKKVLDYNVKTEEDREVG